jgi:transposase
MNAEREKFIERLNNSSFEDCKESAIEFWDLCRKYHTELNDYRSQMQPMILEYKQMQDQVRGDALKIRELEEQNRRQASILDSLRRNTFGQRSERTSDIGRISVADNSDPTDEDADPEENEPEEDQAYAGENMTSTHEAGKKSADNDKTAQKKLARKRRKKHAMDLSRLPETVEYDLDIESLNRMYGEGNWSIYNWNRHSTIEYSYAYHYKKTVFTPILSHGLEYSMDALPYDPFYSHSLASASFMAEIIKDRFFLSLPLYRLEQEFAMDGVPVSRQTMSNWIGYAAELLHPVYDVLCRELRNETYTQCDETTLIVIHDGRKAGRRSYVWVHITDWLCDRPPVIVYCYEPTRNTDHLRHFFAGLDHLLYIVCDAYASYHEFENEMGGLVKVSGCMAHARRRFYKALVEMDLKDVSDEKIEALTEKKCLDMINDIYDADRELLELTADERLTGRKEKVSPLVDRFFESIRNIDLNNDTYSSTFKDAVSYALNQEKYLRRFLEDGNLPIDDNATEREGVKPFVMGRKASLFCNTTKGAENAMVMYSIVNTAKANNVNVYIYLRYLLERMSGSRNKNVISSDMGWAMPWSEEYKKYEHDSIQSDINNNIKQDPSPPKVYRGRKKTA